MNNHYQPGFAGKRKTKEINLRDLFMVGKRRYLVILAVTILAAALGFIKSEAPVTSLYQTSSRIIIGTDDQTITTLEVIVTDPTVLNKVIRKLNLHTSSDALANQISVTNIDSSQVVSITVTASSPVMAAKIANTTAEVFKNEVPSIVGQNYVRLLSMAQVNPLPINKGNNNRLLIYTIAGLIAGIGLAFLLESLDNSIRSAEEAEELLGLPILGKISKINKKNVKRGKRKHELAYRGETIGYK